MNGFEAHLHPSSPESEKHRTFHERRRPGSWCRRRRELLLLTCAGTIGIMLVLAKMPLGESFFSSDHLGAFMAPTLKMTEPLPLITAHEIKNDVPERPAELFALSDALPDSDFEIDELQEVELDQPGLNVPVVHRLPVAVATTTLRDLMSTSEYMYTAITTPTVEEPPKLRLGSMLIEYPLSALKKAIEGLVIVRFTVETDGRAYGINVVSGLVPECDAAVVTALHSARFIPGRSSGRHVPALSQMAIRFKIEERSNGMY